MIKVLKNSKFILLLILLSSFFWRFLNYQNRWVLNQDQARDAVIATYALHNHLLPLLGSPSSAGPFNFGPLYDWLIMAVTFLFPFASGPWVGFTLIFALTPLLFYFIGKNVYHKNFGFLLAAITAFCPAQVANAPDMLNTTIVFFAVTLAFFFLSFYLKNSRLIFAYFFAFSIGLAQNFHFQSLGLFSLLLATFLINRLKLFPRLKLGLTFTAGYLTAFVPLLIFDFTHRHVWITSVFNYYTGGVNKFFIPIRWLTDLRDFWPQTWGEIITNFPALGYLLLAVFIFTFVLSFKKGYPQFRFFWIVLFSLLIQVVLMRYYKGVRSREYLIFLHAYFIFFTAWSFYFLPKPLSALFTLLFLVIASIPNFNLVYKHPSQVQKIYALKKIIDENYEGKLAIYSSPTLDMAAMPIFYLYYRENKIDPAGTPIQITIDPQNNYFASPLSSPPATLQLYTPVSIYNRLFINYPSALP